jgi:hypothetical protein
MESQDDDIKATIDAKKSLEDHEMHDEGENGAASKGDGARKMTEDNQGLNLDSLRAERLMSGGVTSSIDE